jgi:catechol 2,3-dioxygenase-like lactoylglutathione lyase family enzyme
VIPGLRGVDHVGITVPNIEEAVDFFVNVIGAEPFYSLGPYRDDETDFNLTSFGVHPRAIVNQMRLLRLANLNIELFEWDAPDQNRTIPRLSDHGTYELCLYVDDIDEATRHLRSHGVEVLGDKLELEGPEKGENAYYIYFRSPWGALMELISYPGGRAYEAEFERTLWNPSKPDLDPTG